MPAVYRSQLDRDKHVGISPGKMLVVHRKNQKALTLLSLASRPLPNTTHTHDAPAKFAAEHNKDEVLEGRFRNLGVSPATKTDNLVLF